MTLVAAISIATTATLLAGEPQLPSPTFNVTVTGATVRQTTFLAPAAPLSAWAGARLRF
jgi:hypothetical protein